MDGINLSQSMQESKKSAEKKVLLDKGLMGAFVLFLITAAVWGGIWWYLQSIEQQIASADDTLQQKMVGLAGKKTDRASDFFDRSIIIRKGFVDATNPDVLLGQMEKLVVSEVKLTGYQYNKETDTITVSGVTDNFKYLAQQLLVLKTAEGFVSPKVESLKRDKEGKIAFAITAGISSVVQK